MTHAIRSKLLPAVAALCAAAALPAAGPRQLLRPAPPAERQWVVPNARAVAFGERPTVRVAGVEARVRIQGSVARTELRVELANPGPRAAEAELLLPVPVGAAIDGFDFAGAASDPPSVRLLPADEARRTYESIVARLRDPALLEFAGAALVRSSVFPVAAGGRQTIELRYHEVLPAEGRRVEYELPRTASLEERAPLTLHLEVVGAAAAVYSPTHPLREVSRDDRSARFRVEAADPGGFRCAVLWGAGPQASMLACPDPAGPGGTFLLFAGAGARPGESGPPREVTLVLDRSGSMGEGKLDQARAAALQVLEGLAPGERFRVVDYAESVTGSSAAPVAKDEASLAAARAYLAGLRPGGGTNLAGALEAALAPEPLAGTLPVVLLLTDGRPTVGVVLEPEVRALADEANPWGRRVFTFGVGNDVNAPLLDAIALGSRAVSTYVRPGEDVEVAVAGVFRRLAGPVLTDLELRVLGGDGASDATLVRDLLPRRLPDLFAGEQLVLVGRYTAARRARLELAGVGGTLALEVDFAHADGRNAFVPRLWATRRIGELTDAIRQAAGDASPQALLADPRTAELADEILRLSARHGVLTEFTAFLAREGAPLADWDEEVASARRQLVEDNAARSGAAAVNIARNNVAQRTAHVQSLTNAMWTADDRRVTFDGVQQVAGGALFRRDGAWVDGRLLEQVRDGRLPEPDQEVVVGTPEHERLLRELAEDGRADLATRPGVLVYGHRGQVVRQVAPRPAAGERRP